MNARAVSKPIAIIAAGGTGGHLFPAQALAEELLARGFDVKLVTDQRGKAFAEEFPRAETRIVSAATFAGASPLARLLAGLKILSGTFDMWAWFGGMGRAVVVGFGGYPSLPAMAAAILRGRKTIIHDANAVLGRVNRRLAPYVTVIASGFPELANLSPAHKAKLRVTGNPVREAVREYSHAPYRASQAGEGFRIFVFGGSQGARVFSELVPNALALLTADQRARLELVHQVRAEDMEAVRAIYQAAGIPAELKPFFTGMGAQLARAHLVISRAGAGSITDIAVVGRPAILVPLPSAMDDHQTANARAFADAGGGWLRPQADLSAAALAGTVGELMEAPDRMETAARAASDFGRGRAHEALADLVQSLSRS